MTAPDANRSTEPPDRTIIRSDKGLAMRFLPDRVVKDYTEVPVNPHFSREDQGRRLANEIAAYQRFNRIETPFVPRILDHSVEKRFLAIERVRGESLIDASAHRMLLPIVSIIRQINAMNHWLRKHRFPDMGNNIKDLILSQDGRLYLIDFETYAPLEAEPRLRPDVYTAILDDLAERIFIRRGRTARLTVSFLTLAIALFLQRPRSSVRRIVHAIRERRSAAGGQGAG